MFTRKGSVVHLFIYGAITVGALILYMNQSLRTCSQVPTAAVTAAVTAAAEKDDLITDCITKRALGRIPMNLEVMPLSDGLNGSSETGEQRLASFQDVFNSKSWINPGDDPNVVSGAGSTLIYSQEAIAVLQVIITDLKKELGMSRIRMLDVPCGDMTWMSRFLKTRNDIDYTGIDIVPELIKKHQDTFKKYPWKFYQHDIVEKPINESFDLILIRMMLQHLISQDAISVLRRISDSGSKYLLTTTFSRISTNEDLNTKDTGRFRLLNLEIPPFSLIPPKCLSRDGDLETNGGQQHFLGLWKLPLLRVRHCRNNVSMTLIGRNVQIFSCTNWTLST